MTSLSNKIKKFTATTLILSVFLIPISACAASKTFTYNFKHQITVGSVKATTSSIKVETTSSLGGSAGFSIKVYNSTESLIVAIHQILSK